MKNEKNFYVIIHGRTCPAVTQSWAVAHQLVNRFPNNRYKSCSTFAQALEILKQDPDFDGLYFLQGSTDGPSLTSKKNSISKGVYAVAQGRQTGNSLNYSSAVKPQVDKHSGACYKKFSDPTQAAAFVQSYRDARAQIDAGLDAQQEISPS
ncbi:hypothetical protein F4778DRAFT_787436 [Xylariomycetidae sp. FL2044]|nr:hypothetical protein F4778DRAFT_787436 [Xylariomycetidae sp. FL2044]